MPSVLVCGDSPAVRVTLRRTLATLPGITRVAAVGSGEELFANWEELNVDVVLLALGIPGMGCTRAIERIRAQAPQVTVLALAAPREVELLRRAFQAGAHGYLPKDATRSELLGALAHVAANSEYQLHGGQPPGKSGDHEPELNEMIALSRRELQVLMGIAEGASNREISSNLELSNDTVKTHVGRIFRKLRARDRAHAVAIAYRRGIIR
ncbi:MAG TPA: response regulator transcription factor [Actinomycetales bacterium]|nr:response regulator transcription factor [Actinomycetales bacterium]